MRVAVCAGTGGRGPVGGLVGCTQHWGSVAYSMGERGLCVGSSHHD